MIIVTGPPGAGKTTVARLLTEEPDGGDAPSVHLHTDDFWHFVRRGRIAPFLPAAHRQNEVVLGVVAGAACGYARGGYHVVVDGIVGPWFLGLFREAAARHGLPVHYVVLRPDEATTVRRAAGRSGDALTATGPVRDLHRQFGELGELERHALDSSGLTAEQTAGAVRRGIADGRFLLVP